MKDLKILIFLGTVVLILVFYAIKWEASDIKKVYSRRNVYDIKNIKEREKEYKFYSTYNHSNNIMWRSIFICAVISSIVIYLFLKKYGNKYNMEMNIFPVMFIIFIVFYFNHQYRSFHIYRVMASKINKYSYIMDNIK